MTAVDLILCRSDFGDGGWSLHAPGVDEAAIADGTAPPLLTGPADWDATERVWDRPSPADYALALERVRSMAAPSKADGR